MRADASVSRHRLFVSSGEGGDVADERVISAPTDDAPAPVDESAPAPAPQTDSTPPESEASSSAPVSAPSGVSAGRMRTRLARIGTKGQSTNPVLEPLFRAVRLNHPKADLALLERAYKVSEQAHRGQIRKSGEPYITHPLAVTTILAELGMTET